MCNKYSDLSDYTGPSTTMTYVKERKIVTPPDLSVTSSDLSVMPPDLSDSENVVSAHDNTPLVKPQNSS